MKQKTIFVMLYTLCIILFATACATEKQPSIPSSTNTTETIETAKIIDYSSYFTLKQKDSLYYYEIYDISGRIIVSSDPQPKSPDIEMVNDMLMRITTQAGTGIGTQTGYFCDVETGQKSKDFSSIFDQCNNLVAYAQNDKIIVESIFDECFYQEITNFQFPFSSVAFPFENAEFINNCQGIRITYLSGTDYAEVSEEFDVFSGSTVAQRIAQTNY